MDRREDHVASFKNHLPGFVVAVWVMASVIIAVAYALCLGAAEAVAAHRRDTTQGT
jgi:hypothetical protein